MALLYHNLWCCACCRGGGRVMGSEMGAPASYSISMSDPRGERNVITQTAVRLHTPHRPARPIHSQLHLLLALTPSGSQIGVAHQTSGRNRLSPFLLRLFLSVLRWRMNGIPEVTPPFRRPLAERFPRTTAAAAAAALQRWGITETRSPPRPLKAEEMQASRLGVDYGAVLCVL